MGAILQWIKGRFHTFDYLHEYFHAVRLHFLDVTWGIGVGAGAQAASAPTADPSATKIRETFPSSTPGTTAPSFLQPL